MHRLLLAVAVLLIAAVAFAALAVLGFFGETQGRGEITETARARNEVGLRGERQARARESLGDADRMAGRLDRRRK